MVTSRVDLSRSSQTFLLHRWSQCCAATAVVRHAVIAIISAAFDQNQELVRKLIGKPPYSELAYRLCGRVRGRGAWFSGNLERLLLLKNDNRSD